MKFSVIIPARNEAKYIGKCLHSVEQAARPYPGDVEVVVVLNRCTDTTEEIALAHGARIAHDDRKCLSAIRNTGVRASSGRIIATIDADSWMTANTLSEIERWLSTGRFIGGGVAIKAERMSPGIMATVMLLAPIIFLQGLSAGILWCYREDFEAIGGFDESLLSAEDVDFARRLRAYGRKRGKRFKTITKAHLVTSTRKYDRLGDWFIVKNLRLGLRLLGGRDQEAANRIFYDFERDP